MEHMRERNAMQKGPVDPKKSLPVISKQVSKGLDDPRRPVPKIEMPDYVNLGTQGDDGKTKFNKQDSLLYRQGFNRGLKDKKSKPQSLGGKRVVGLSERFNEGVSEGKDKAILKRGDRNLSDRDRDFLDEYKTSQANKKDYERAQANKKKK